MKTISLIIAFVIIIGSSKKLEAQYNDVALNDIASNVDTKTRSADKNVPKRRLLDPNANVSKRFVASHYNFVKTSPTQVSIGAVRDFLKTYPDIPDVKWFKTDGGHTAYFDSNGIQTKIVYDNKGQWFYNLFTYPEDKMKFELRDMVKSKYYDHSIIVVYEYDFGTKTIFLITICDKESKMETLKVCDGKVENITRRE